MGKNLRNFHKKDNNIRIAKDTCFICQTGKYRPNSRVVVDILDSLDKSINNTELLDDVVIANPIKQNPYFKVKDNLINKGTIDTIIELRESGVDGNIIALNFASAKNPGGGFLNGSSAQEESLARASGLYFSLKTQSDFYNYHKENLNPLYTDKMIYSPNVPVFRNDSGVLMPKYIEASFLTSPAVNAKVARSHSISENEIHDVMANRVAKIISEIARRKPDVAVLGAFGCGVFGNNRDIVYRQFEDSINKFIEKDTIQIVFAVI